MGWRGGVLVAVIIGALVAACSTAKGRRGSVMGAHAWPATLSVRSASVDHVAVRLNGFRIGTITRGHNCIVVPSAVGPLVLDLVSLAGSARVSEPILLARGGHWTLALGAASRLGTDVLTLRAAEHGCAAGPVDRPR